MAAELARLQDEIRAKERLSTFARVAAGLAHDLQAPIESVRAACDLAIRHPQDEGARDLLRSAASVQVPRLSRYVRDLRRLAEEGHVPLDLQSVDAHAIAEQVIGAARVEPKWEGVEFAVEGRCEPIWVDQSLLERAITNLVGNAADACVGLADPRGHVTVRLGDTGRGDHLTIEVIDTGVGIAAAALDQLLVNDFRSTKRNSGVGLGLAVSRHIAAAHGGAITAESRLGVGSTFRLSVPRSAVAGRSAGDEGESRRQNQAPSHDQDEQAIRDPRVEAS
jgi:signal transduction histidine kinase